jgi:hypothetical protein
VLVPNKRNQSGELMSAEEVHELMESAFESAALVPIMAQLAIPGGGRVK